VLRGRFSVPKLSATSHLNQAAYLMGQRKVPEALGEAQMASAIDPDSLNAQMQCATILKRMKRSPEAQPYFQGALVLAKKQDLAPARIAAIEQAAR
jgi:Tfp pilus assembly protein PilF